MVHGLELGRVGLIHILDRCLKCWFISTLFYLSLGIDNHALIDTYFPPPYVVFIPVIPLQFNVFYGKRGSAASSSVSKII